MNTGYIHLNLTDSEINKLYQDDSFLLDQLYENQYAILYNMDDDFIDIRVRNQGEIKKVNCYEVENMWTGKIKPRNLEQKLAFDMMSRDDIKVKVLTGTHGAGKDIIMSNFALQGIFSNKYDKIFWVRNNIELADCTPLGALPGDVKDKIIDFAMPLADHLGGTMALEKLIADNKLEIQHLGYMRGRDLKNCIIYCSEAENLTTKQVQLLLGRVGEGSCIFFNGDYRQSDKKIFKKDSGLLNMIQKLSGNPLFGYVKLVKSERSEVARLADLLDIE